MRDLPKALVGSGAKVALQNTIKDHTVIPYTASTETWAALKVLDEDPLSARNVVLIYAGPTTLIRDQHDGSIISWDCERLRSQSFGIRARNSALRDRPPHDRSME